MRQVDGGKETCGTRGDLYGMRRKAQPPPKAVLNVQKSAEAIVAYNREGLNQQEFQVQPGKEERANGYRKRRKRRLLTKG